jgi:hypothetical protein
MTQVNNPVSLISIYAYKLVMLIENIIETVTRKHNTSNSDLRTWAKIEFKNEANYAYYHVKEFGVAPTLGAEV